MKLIRRVLIATTAVVAIAATTAHAGPALDDILNYMFRDQSTPMDRSRDTFVTDRGLNLMRGAPVGQTFITGPETAKIVRIRGKLTPDADWQQGEGARIALWDSPAKKTALGRYTVWYEFRGYRFAQPEWEIGARVKPNTRYYLELSYAGKGDGKLSQIGLMNGRDGYKDGQGYLAGKEADFDLCFQTHTKRKPNRTANLKKGFSRFNLDMPELAHVKAAVDKGDFNTAQARLVSYFENRQKPVPTLPPPKPVSDFDINTADRALSNYFLWDRGSGYAGPDINWRAEPDFNPDGTIAELGWSAIADRLGPRQTLTKAYLVTGKDKYVKKLNDILIDWYLDNPPPDESHIGGDRTDPVWVGLNAAVRLGAGFILYSRIAKSSAFTLDCRTAYILSLADEADVLVSGANFRGGSWLHVMDSALFQFGSNFPEFKNSSTWRDTGSKFLGEFVKNDKVGDSAPRLW